LEIILAYDYWFYVCVTVLSTCQFPSTTVSQLTIWSFESDVCFTSTHQTLKFKFNIA